MGQYSLSGILTKSIRNSKEVILLLHPHPLYGGDMDNPIVMSLENKLLQLGFATFRFNFRGASNSHDSFEGMSGAVIDTEKAAQSLKERDYVLYSVIGYSFGGSAALRFAISNPLMFLITLSASLSLFTESGYPLHTLSGINCPILMFHGTSDRVVPFTDMEVLSAEMEQKAKTVQLSNEGHFYIHSISTILYEVEKFISSLKKT